jgi:putative salt-induced outer membrane protein YdiY
LLQKLFGVTLLVWLVAPAWCDQLTLKNGDRITGKIVKKDGDKIAFKSDVFGDISVPWAAVTEVTSDEPLTVVLPDGRAVKGKLSTEEGKVVIAEPAARDTVPLTELTAARNDAEQKAYERFQEPRWIDLWAGYFDIGLSTARGNAKATTLTTAANAARVTRTDKTTLYFNQIFANATVDNKSQRTAEAVRGGWAYNHNVNPRIFVNVFNDYEYDAFQNLDLRFVAGGGLGYMAIKNDRQRLDLLGGAAYNRESFSTPLTRNSAEAYWGDDWSYNLSSISSLKQSFRMFNNLSDTGTYRINFDLSAVTTLKKWLSWQVTTSDRYLSNPVTGRQKNDILLTTGLRISFAR